MDIKEVKLTPKWNWWIEPKFTPLGELEAPLSQEAFGGKLLKFVFKSEKQLVHKRGFFCIEFSKVAFE